MTPNTVLSAKWLVLGVVLLAAWGLGAASAADPEDRDIPYWQRQIEGKGPMDPGGWLYDVFHAMQAGDCDTMLRRIGDGEAEGDSGAFTYHGRLHELGGCAPLDYAKAAEFYHMAVERDDDYAPLLLGDLYLTGRGVPRDGDAAWHLFRRGVLHLVDTADEERERRLWSMMGARGLPGELRLALDWMRELERGGPAKQLEVALGLWEGDDGLPRDRVSAVEWLETAAEAGLPRAQYELAKWINMGRAPEKTPGRAKQWMFKAAIAGHTPAQIDLGLRFARGDGARQDDVAAYAWFLRARSAGADVSEHLPALEQRMSEYRIEWAERLAKEPSPGRLHP